MTATANDMSEEIVLLEEMDDPKEHCRVVWTRVPLSFMSQPLQALELQRAAFVIADMS